MALQFIQTIKSTYWNVGRHIVEFEQQGNARAKYGTSLLSHLAKILRARVGRGYSRPNLNNMRKFYLLFSICQTSDKSEHAICQMSEKLTWSHICELITIDDSLEREFYLNECIAEGWTVDALHRQKESGLFMRLALSKDKEGVIELAHKGQQIQTAEDVVKDIYTLVQSETSLRCFWSYSLNVTGMNQRTRTASPRRIPGCHLGIAKITRTASASSNGWTLLTTLTS